MLALTENAVDAIKHIVETSDLPEGAGLRIAAQPELAGQYSVSLIEAPEQDDEVVEVEGARVFLDAAVSPAFESKVLDVHAQPGGGLAFTLMEQS